MMAIPFKNLALILIVLMLMLFGFRMQDDACQPRADWVVVMVGWQDEPEAIAEHSGITVDELAAGNCWTEDVSFPDDVLIRVPPEFITPTSTAWEILFPEVLPDEKICNVVFDELPQVILHPGGEWQPIGVMAWYAPLIGFTSTGYIIGMEDGRAGWVSEVGVHLDGDCQAMLDNAFDGETLRYTSPPDFSTGLTHWIMPRHVTYETETLRLVYRDESFDSPLIAGIPLGASVPVLENMGQMQSVRLSPHHIGWTSVYGW